MQTALYLIPYPRFFSQHNNVGGHVAHAYGITAELAASGVEVHIVMDEDIDLMHGRNRTVHLAPLADNSAFKRILWGKSLVQKVAGLVRETGAEVCYMRYSVGFQNWLPALKRSLGTVPLVVEVNSFGSQRRGWMAPLEGRFLAAADLIVAISKPVADKMESLWGPRIANKTIIVNNGVDPGRFPDWDQAAARPFGTVVRAGYTGLMETWYGLDDVARGFLQAKADFTGEAALELHFVGDGPHLKTMRERYADQPSIVFHGARPFSEMPEIISGLDILINSDSPRKAYTSPIKIYEYMSSGRPILSASTAQSRMQLEDGRFGWYYELDQPESVAKALQHLLETPQDRIEEKTRAARKFVEENHTWKQRLAYILSNIPKGLP